MNFHSGFGCRAWYLCTDELELRKKLFNRKQKTISDQFGPFSLAMVVQTAKAVRCLEFDSCYCLMPIAALSISM